MNQKTPTRICVNIPSELEKVIASYWKANHGLKSRAYNLVTEEMLRLFKKDEAKFIGAIGTGKLRIIIE